MRLLDSFRLNILLNSLGEDILLNSLRKICVNSTLKLPTSSQEPVFKQNDVKSYAKNSIMWLKQNNLVVSYET